MKRAVLLISVFLFIMSCDRYPDPSVKSVRDYSFAFITEQGTRVLSGEWVSDSIIFRAVNNLNPYKDQVKVVFEVIKGGGEITVSSGYTDTVGYVYTGWKLGTGSFEQILRASSYDMSGTFLASTDLTAYGFRTDEWDEIHDAAEYGISDLASDTVNMVTLAIINGRLWKQADNYFTWKEIPDNISETVSAIEIDNNKVFYVLSWTGNLYKSNNHGESWIICSKPYSQINYNAKLKVSNDNYVWVSGYTYPVKFSKDGGVSWNEVTEEVSAHGLSDVFRLKDGSLLLHGSDCCYMFKSFDDGITWIRILTPGYSLKLYVDENDAIYIVTQEGGMTIYKSTDYGKTYRYIYACSPAWTSSMENTFNRRDGFYYVFIQGFGILKSKDLTTFEIYWQNFELGNLFIDDKGVLIGKNWSWQYPYPRIIYYRNNSDN
jgi:photosystem II stability/assembly factor-like uncharacterized protein